MSIGNTADLILEDEEGILLVMRKNPPFQGCWALPGGFLEPGRENLKQTGIRELKEETGIIAREEDLVLIGEYSSPERDPRGHVISHAYYVRKYEGREIAGDDAARVKRFQRNSLPQLAFDHARILQDYFDFRRNVKNGN